MNDPVPAALLTAMQIAAFERRADGSFASVAPPPGWFGPLVADPTFPFLGHILEDAGHFWQSGLDGARDYGPCADVDDRGREFHYKVTALAVGGRQFLVFQLDPGGDQLREVLQKVRARALEGGFDPSSQAALAAVRKLVRRKGEEMHELLRRWLSTAQTEAQFELWRSISARCDELMDNVEKLTDHADRH